MSNNITNTEIISNFESQQNYRIKNSEVRVQCPSNIALIKYWGKFENQLPANPSISFTLNHCHTKTKLSFRASEAFSVKTYLSGHQEPIFAKKIENYFISIKLYLPFILQGSYEITTENTFPHSSGIASSASGFGAIALALMALDSEFSDHPLNQKEALVKASFLARLGSGSACRSLYNGLVVWGETEVCQGSSDLFAKVFPREDVHPIFRNFNDWVLLIHEGSKSVSSSVGHQLMNAHPYAEKRFEEARKNMITMKTILKSGDLNAFMELVEHEALGLHAMMMLSNPAFLLMKSGTLHCIEKIWEFRKETQLPLFFTLDAGANVHLLFPKTSSEEKIKIFIEKDLLPLSQNLKIVKDEIYF